MFKLCHVQEKLIPFSSIYKIFFKSQKMSKIYNAIDLSIILSYLTQQYPSCVYLKKSSNSKTSPRHEKEMKMQRWHPRIDLQFLLI